MIPMLVDASLSLLLVVDVQDRLAPVMDDRDRVVRNSTILMKAATELGVPVVVSEQYPKGLGPTIPELRSLARDEDVYAKNTFSCLRDEAIAARFAAENRPQTIVAGIESHVCVLQSALDLVDRRGNGGGVFVVADAVDSRRPDSREIALDRLRQAGVSVVTTEMVVFEWLRTAASPSFKALSKLIR